MFGSSLRRALSKAGALKCLLLHSRGGLRHLLLQHTVAQVIAAVLQGCSDVCWNAASSYLASASDDNTLRLWDAQTAESLRTLEGHTHYVFCCTFNPQGNLLVSLPA